jgi:hypothetical protein
MSCGSPVGSLVKPPDRQFSDTPYVLDPLLKPSVTWVSGARGRVVWIWIQC